MRGYRHADCGSVASLSLWAQLAVFCASVAFCIVGIPVEPCLATKGPKSKLQDQKLTQLIDEMAENILCPTPTEIWDEAKQLVQDANNCNSETVQCLFGKTPLKGSINRNSDNFSAGFGQLVESHRAQGELTLTLTLTQTLT